MSGTVEAISELGDEKLRKNDAHVVERRPWSRLLRLNDDNHVVPPRIGNE